MKERERKREGEVWEGERQRGEKQRETEKDRDITHSIISGWIECRGSGTVALEPQEICE